MTADQTTDAYFDPYDVAIDANPYPVFRRLRDEAPLYYNEKHDFYALSRFEDVAAGLAGRETYISGRGGVLELIKANIQMPPGVHNRDYLQAKRDKLGHLLDEFETGGGD